jgi:hypothetical protein
MVALFLFFGAFLRVPSLRPPRLDCLTCNLFSPFSRKRLGREFSLLMANEGSYPENARALALNGAEVALPTRTLLPQTKSLKLGVANGGLTKNFPTA